MASGTRGYVVFVEYSSVTLTGEGGMCAKPSDGFGVTGLLTGTRQDQRTLHLVELCGKYAQVRNERIKPLPPIFDRSDKRAEGVVVGHPEGESQIERRLKSCRVLA